MANSTRRAPTVLLRDIVELSRAFEAHLGRELGVNATDREAMEHLIAAGPLSPTNLSQRLGVSTAAVTAVVDRLVAHGHAERMPHPTDRRQVIVAPTTASVDRAMNVLLPMIGQIDATLDGFSASEQDAITRFLEHVVASYRQHLPETAP